MGAVGPVDQPQVQSWQLIEQGRQELREHLLGAHRRDGQRDAATFGVSDIGQVKLQTGLKLVNFS